MTIKVKITKSANAKELNCKVNAVVDIELEDYVCGVVASEVGNAPLETCKAQAVAARTNAMAYYKLNKAISDSGSSAQTFNYNRMHSGLYMDAWLATLQTDGEVLYYNEKLCSPCSFSASNGGETTSAKERWGNERAWLIKQVDPYDFAITKGHKTGHGVGMSQTGAEYMAKNGHDYTEILSFYYPGTHIENIYGNDINGDDDMAYANVKASYLIDKFKQMKTDNWQYVANSAEKGKVDCSGAFTYWYKQAGSYMYHGSNTMYRKYSTTKGKIGSVELVPGMAVYRWHNDGNEPSQYRNDGLGNFSHVGLYVGGGKCIEAKGTKSGIVESDISTWAYASKLKYTIYDVTEDGLTAQTQADDAVTIQGTVKTTSGNLNLRSAPSTKTGSIQNKVPSGTRLGIIDILDGWYKVQYNGKQYYASADYVILDGAAQESTYTISVNVKESEKDKMIAAIKNAGGTPSIVKDGV